MKDMENDLFVPAVQRLAALLTESRERLSLSRRHMADAAHVHWSIAYRAERGEDLRLSTWEKLFAGLGYRLEWRLQEWDEEYPDVLIAQADDRRRRREEGLWTGKNRFY
jgi:hypothetical protein